jgi:hypothetical protein
LILLSDRTSEVSEAMWELDRRFGLDLSVPDQRSIASAIGSAPAGGLTVATIVAAFASRGVKPPPRTYAKALVARVETIAPRADLLDVLVEYRRFAIRELSGQFGGKTTGREEELRNNLLTFLPERGYTEARSGRGRTDILLPNPKRIIEVKVWTTRLVYEDGLVELGRYIHTENAEAAYVVVFGDREPLPEIVDDHTTAIAERRPIEGIVVPVVVVPFEVDQASKAAGNARRRARAGHR